MASSTMGGAWENEKAASSSVDSQVSFERSEWVTQAKCRQGDPDALFVRGAQQRSAAIICRHCTVRIQCLADALDNDIEFGVWGGLTERQRRALRRQVPDNMNWTKYLAEGGRVEGL